MTLAKFPDHTRTDDPAVAHRRLPIGAEVLPDAAGVHFRVWALSRKSVDVAFDASSLPDVPLAREDNGYFAGVAPAARAGVRYRFRLDGEQYLYPDPVSRFQPEGPHGPSQVVDPAGYAWADDGWPGVGPAGLVLYEM